MFASNTSQVSSDAVFIEDTFSTTLYTGTGSGTVTINNGIDVAGKGGLVWLKDRSAAWDSRLVDTARGNNQILESSTTAASTNYGPTVSLTSTGYTVSSGYLAGLNGGGNLMASWTFRKQPKFFDVVTFTSNASGGATINHSLGSAPGCVIVKSTASTGNWFVYHRSMDPAEYLYLNTTDASMYGGRTVTTSSTQVTYPSGYFANSTAYVAYLFAHNAGGFGLTGTDNVISCGSWTGNGSLSGPTVTLGYEPQWLLYKNATGTGGESWVVVDNMRGFSTTQNQELLPNSSSAEFTWPLALPNLPVVPTATGFNIASADPSVNESGKTFIYIAIRRGPMKTPTSGTSVFSPNASNAPADGTQITTNFPVDLSIWKSRGGSYSGQFQDRLRGLPASAGTGTATLYPDSTAAESNNQTGYQYWNTGFKTYSAENNIWWNFRRAPGFFDEVCYTAAAGQVSHNLGVAPELVIYKTRSGAGPWQVCAATNGFGDFTNGAWAGLGNGSGLGVNLANATSTTIANGSIFYGSGPTLVTYLFASCPGVSKVGNYTGTGTTQQINCGFTGGARFVLIKRTDSTGDWYVWDSARGIVAGNDPYLLLNSTAAEVTSTDYVDTYSAGFEISSTAPAAINASGGSFVYLAIA